MRRAFSSKPAPPQSPDRAAGELREDEVLSRPNKFNKSSEAKAMDEEHL